MAEKDYNEYKEVAWAKMSVDGKFQPIWINRPHPTDYDVQFEMKYCGICFSDVHISQNGFGDAKFPFVPGHELAGVVTKVGPKVTKVKVGDNVGVGVISDSCLDCQFCEEGDEQYCSNGKVDTYNNYKSKTKSHLSGNPDDYTKGGYSGSNVIHEHFVFKIPDSIPLEKCAPILCAGITMYDPLKYWGATSGKKMSIGIVGVGGLGTMGLKIAKALGHRVVAISSSNSKREIAKEKGADDYVVSTDPESMKTENGKLDLILNTVSADHQCKTYIPLLKTNGTLIQLGLVMKPHEIYQMTLFQRKSIAASNIGGIKNTQELLEFCAKHDLFPDVEVVTADKLDWVYENLEKNAAKGLRYVLDVQESLKNKDLIPKQE